jgi:hypothetical protein
LCALERLDRRFLVDRQHPRDVGRRQIEPDDVANPVHEKRVGRQLQGRGAMRLQTKSCQIRWVVEGA